MIFRFHISHTSALLRAPMIESIHEKYPVDIFHVDFSSCHKIVDNVQRKHNLIFYEDVICYDHTINELVGIMESHPDKKFYFFTDHHGLDKLTAWPNNAYFVPYTIIAPMEVKNYRQYEPLMEKNFNSVKIGITLNRLPRPHRLCWISYLLGKNFDNHCVISAPLLRWHIEQNGNNIKDVLSWKGIDISNDFGTTVLQGWKRAQKQDGLHIDTDAYPPYDQLEPIAKEFLNFENYSTNLVPLYKNSFVEYISHTQYETNLQRVDEKYLNSQLGANFPICLGPAGLVHFLRDRGFDMFDDVVNNDHDSESDPRLRLESAFVNNRHLIEDVENTKKLWKENANRFQHNVDLFFNLCEAGQANAEDQCRKIFAHD